MTLVAPHGGALVDRIVPADRVAALAAEAASLPRITLDDRELADLELIATGAASPLTGFLGAADYARVLAELRLADGTVWPVPFVLAVDDRRGGELAAAGAAALVDATGRTWGVIRIDELYARDPIAEVRAAYGTDDVHHPGVAYTLSRPRTLVGGAVDVLPLPADRPFAARRLTPRQLRAEIAARGWTTVAGFQTRNPLHRAHEHLTRLALELCDGLVLHPLAGETRGDDLPADVRFRTYEVLVERYYPAARTILAALPGTLRWAGPREALLHALVRKNYGITSLIVGRDHAGDGAHYEPRAAHAIFDAFTPDELGVTPLRFEPTFFCLRCDGPATVRTCAHDPRERLELSGRKVRDILRAGGDLPRELVRPEVAAILRAHVTPAAPREVAPARAPAAGPGQGFILWFTGMSGAGKSTLSAALAARLAGLRPLEVLDGDEVRTHLSKGLGFSRADRDTNVGRIAFVARTLARHGVGVITAAISPYAETRRDVRAQAEAQGIPFVEVWARAELSALVERDVKGLYKKALAGEIPHFTGVSDPYEPPENADVEVRTDRETVDESVAKILGVLAARGLVELPAEAPAGPAAGSAAPRAAGRAAS